MPCQYLEAEVLSHCRIRGTVVCMSQARPEPATRLPLVIYVLALGTFLMGTTEFVVAGLLRRTSRATSG